MYKSRTNNIPKCFILKNWCLQEKNERKNQHVKMMEPNIPLGSSNNKTEIFLLKIKKGTKNALKIFFWWIYSNQIIFFFLFVDPAYQYKSAFEVIIWIKEKVLTSTFHIFFSTLNKSVFYVVFNGISNIWTKNTIKIK